MYCNDSDIATKCEDLINKIELLVEEDSEGGKRHYRFGDVVLQGGCYWKESIDFILNNSRFQGTILRNYIERRLNKNLADGKKNYIHLLSEIVQDKLKDKAVCLPEKNELVIHMRLGDMFEPNKKYVDIIKLALLNNNYINKVIFCTAFHYGNNVTQGTHLYTDEKHKKNISALRNIFTKILTNVDIPIDIKSSKNIDEDFIYMIMAKHFNQGSGNFSHIIKKIRDYRHSIGADQFNE